MATVPPQLEDVAAAIERMRTATGPAARVQAVRAAADAVGRMSRADRQVLARGLLAHGAPMAGRALEERSGDQVPPQVLLSIAQDLLALAPIETERLEGELRDAAQLAAAAEPPGNLEPRSATEGGNSAAQGRAEEPVVRTPATRHAGSLATGPPTPSAATDAPADPAPTPPPVPDAVRRRAHGAGGVRREAVRPLVTSPARSWSGGTSDGSSPAEQVRAAPDLRGRLDRATALTGGRGPLPGPEVLALLRAFPDGWQRRTALRRLVAAPGVALGADALAVVEAFARAADRFAVAAQLVRAGGVSAEQVLPALGARPGLRLRARAARDR